MDDTDAHDSGDTQHGDAALGRAWLDDTPWELLSDLTAIGNRMGGSDGERRAADLVADAFRDAGLDDVHLHEFDTNRWTRGSASLDLLEPDERAFETIALPYCPPGEVEGELVDVGHGTPAEVDEADVDGKIAVASTTTPSGGRFVHRMEKFGHAVEAGALGFVFVNHVAGQLPPTGALRFDEEADAIAVGVSKETGAWLTDYADRGGRVRLSVDARTDPATSQNVLGSVGAASGEDDAGADGDLLLLAHYDAHDIAEGALDNGCGIAVVVAAARLLAQLDLDRRVRVAAVGCEETGLVGSEALADRLALDDVAAVVNVDGAGRFRDLVAMTHTSESTADVARTVADETGQPIRVEPEPHPFSDQWPFVRRGVPSLQLHSDSGERGRGWAHTTADTRDKVDPRNLREHAMLTALLVRELAARDPARLDTDALAAAFRDADFERGMRAADLWPTAW
ncbi:Zn-dependent amino-or carboxypeptidase, M28 family [Halogranum gelatinilyticum]|uniref:Carboxypeptidase Q n=1 Tax=Halogranum gelatinilyticum TaxID=660521 RepID=A0A1G9XQC4_9EURY|nr:M28 family metallopeptidase [Halogranum gelatinilyticum]SDM98473.1 Zn-dependent amino-or carboxypeptidase, M28 family [Halogranum gelatinilyticum]